MKITIDNLDGAGAVDYSAALCADGPLKIERVLNAPSRCTGMLDTSSLGLATPVRRGRVTVSNWAGAVLFTGYIATEPELVYAGVGTMGPVYRAVFSAISDEWLLDKQAIPLSGAALAQPVGQVLKTLTSRVEAGLFTTAGVADGRSVGVFQPVQSEAWSINAGNAAAATYAAYRVMAGAITLQPAGAVTHALSDGDGTLEIAALKTSAVRELANDVTLSGEMEPAAYISEVFSGDGTTASFQLSEAPFKAKGTENPSMLLSDSFNQGSFNAQVWTVEDAGEHLGLSSAGLRMTGGTGLDGQTTLTAIDAVEMGGTLVVEAGGLVLDASSAGIVCGLYSGAIASANCIVGYNARPSDGSTMLVPFVNGAEVGTSFTMLAGHSYTLRIRLHCAEMQRVQQAYYAMVDGVVQSFGGGLVPAALDVVFELQDLGAASNTPATVLYDGAIASTPASCIFVAVNSVQLIGSMAYCRITQTGSAWVVSTLPNGTKFTRLIGVAGEGVDCKVSTTGLVTFLAGRIPVAGEIVTVVYRGSSRSVARLQNAASVAAETTAGAPGTACWIGSVTQPAARSSVDCEFAAQAVLSFASARAAAIAGSYAAINPGEDIWPGDVLSLTNEAQTTNVVVRKVDIEDGLSEPETLTYRMAFANDWAEGLGLKLSDKIAANALIPQTAADAPGGVLANLPQLQVTSITGSALQIDAGVAPPVGGGFEVRRRDGDFGPGIDQDLVLRSPVRSFSIPRAAQTEHYFVRMFDASTPPLYSRFSSAVFTNFPVS